MTQINPLKQYFRQPAIYIRLPSQGKYYPPGVLDMPANGELPVFPMTAVDEITYRTPDALFNGAAVVSVIQSCVPNIRDAWNIPAMDLDTILVGIRVASYGHEMDVVSQCPKCSHESNFNVDLRMVLDQMKTPDYEKSIVHRDLEIYFRPMSYQELNENNQMQFDEQRIFQMLPDQEIPEQEKLKAISDALKKITEITVQALAQSIAAIKTPQALVTEPEFIKEMLQNCDTKIFNAIRDHIVEMKNQSELQPLKIACSECQNEYRQNITLNMASFFGVAS
jgi:bacterioferritin-associated ferredoxin